MEHIALYFNKFLNLSLRILLLFIVISSTLLIVAFKLTSFSIVFIIVFTALFFATYYFLKNNFKKSIITILLIFSLIIRILCFLNIDSIPIGDFNRIFLCASDFLNGSTYMFKGTSYIARFPHMSMTVLYFALIRKMFSNPLITIKLINIIFSMFNVILLFFISKEVFEDKTKSIWVLFLSAIYPPMILYNNVYCSENLAILLLLSSILMFLKSFNFKNKNAKLLFILLSGVFLSFTQLFRPIGYVMLIAYIMFILIYFKESIKNRLIMSLSIIVTFIIPFVIVSYTLISLNITEYPLWHGTEPPSISFLKGTNIKLGGRWNEEDSSLFNKYDGNYKKIDMEAKKIIKERLTKTPFIDLIKFYKLKYENQWTTGDFGGSYWSEEGLDEAYNKEDYLKMLGKDKGKMFIRVSEQGMLFIQLFFIIILMLSYIGLYKNRKNINFKIDLFYIIFCGVSLQCLITEFQARYSYPFSWIFLILAITAFNTKTSNHTGGLRCKS